MKWGSMSGMPRITLIDYGVGNLLSVTRALDYCGADVVLTSDPAQIVSAERVVLPGVGAFGDGMSGLRQYGLIEPILEFVGRGRPFLGICLGMQMMLDASEEFGMHEGLGLIPGRVVSIPATSSIGEAHKIPHIGWNHLYPLTVNAWQGTILREIVPGEAFYFVHSFTAQPKEADHALAACEYNGREITAVIRSGNMYGCQFHPEKSGTAGLNILQSFCAL